MSTALHGSRSFPSVNLDHRINRGFGSEPGPILRAQLSKFNGPTPPTHLATIENPHDFPEYYRNINDMEKNEGHELAAQVHAKSTTTVKTAMKIGYILMVKEAREQFVREHPNGYRPEQMPFSLSVGPIPLHVPATATEKRIIKAKQCTPQMPTFWEANGKTICVGVPLILGILAIILVPYYLRYYKIY